MPNTLAKTRKVALTMYVAYAIGGILFFVEHSGLIYESVTPPAVYVWHLFLVAGSAVSAYGATTKKFAIEGVGIPLLGSALIAYAAVLLVNGLTNHNGVQSGLGFLIIGAFLGLVERGCRVWQLTRIAEDLNRRS